jgi:hypothetical protein
MVQDELVASSTTHDAPGAPPRAEYIIGVDLGQAAEHSALCLLERTEHANGDDKPIRRFGCPYLKRWPLGTAFPAILTEITALVKRPALRECTLVLGATGLGLPLIDMFRRAKLPVKLEPVFIRTGQDETVANRVHHVAKVSLISSVLLPLQERRLVFAQSLPDVLILIKELQNYRTKTTQPTNDLIDIREGQNDDLVVALGLGCWWGERRKREVTWWA